ncbi:hypothetical protein DSM43518_02545 [Mycobacterium marinum]|nr:hypothetical protein [Mycobacterium marinum]RFZ09794.1 hypothetical protein DSM43518_02545 [Mycobacterium marinum]
MGYCAYSLECDFRVEATEVRAALAAVHAAFGVEFTSLVEAVEELANFDECEIDESGAFILGRHVDSYLEDTEKLLRVLGGFAVDGSFARFDGEDGSLFGFRVVNGRLREEYGDYVWTLAPTGSRGVPRRRVVSDSTTLVAGSGGGLVPLVFFRDHVGFEAWWDCEAMREDIAEMLAELSEDGLTEGELWLHALFEEVFQGSPSPVEWLCVDGLRAGVEVGYMSLDIDPSYDGDGVRDGVDVVANLWADQNSVFEGRLTLTVSVYLDRPCRMFVPVSTNPREALAEVIDSALALINNEISRRDQFITAMRECVA